MNNKIPSVSIIIPAYNSGKYIGKALRSVIEQTYTNWEAVIINNYSDDNTVAVCNSFNEPRFKLINFRNNGVIAASRNEGIRLSTGEYIAFLDSDDWWYPEKLTAAIKHLNNADITFHDLDIYTVHGKCLLKRMKGRKLSFPVFVDLLIRGNALHNSSVVLKKTILEQIGGLREDPSLISVEDYDLWLRIAQITERFVYISESLGGYWVGTGNLSGASKTRIQRLDAICHQYIGVLNDTDKKSAEALKDYMVGRLSQKLGDRKEAINRYWKAMVSPRIALKVKSLILIIILSLNLIGISRNEQ